MNSYNILIKFKKEAILSRTDETLILRDFAIQDNFLNQFTCQSIVTDEMLSPQKRINRVNFKNLTGICYVRGLNQMPLEEKENLAKKWRPVTVLSMPVLKLSKK